MISVDEIRKDQRAQGTATILAIRTANPPHYIEQSKFPITYFLMTHDDQFVKPKGGLGGSGALSCGFNVYIYIEDNEFMICLKGWKKNEARNREKNQQQTMGHPMNQRMTSTK
ncbi:hypothetical protein Pint_16478 [Pistacia integerrima]|uniref:Uncharacterized protein n=1 Tax=Pistacia integerrima TaxID=434235 RepID=A0ACC0ZBA5_9ROSI|nr:hypothetical protein Pint_16478 [Pistacia integerrima]